MVVATAARDRVRGDIVRLVGRGLGVQELFRDGRTLAARRAAALAHAEGERPGRLVRHGGE